MAKIIIDLGGGNGKKTFKNIEELRSFVLAQQQFWQQFFQGNINQNPVAVTRNFMFEKFDSMIRYINQINETQMEQVSGSISTYFQQTPILYTDSKSVKYINLLAAKDPDLAKYMPGFFTKQLYGYISDPMATRAIFEGLKFESGIESNIDSEKEALGLLKKEWDEKLSNAEEKFYSLNTDITGSKDEIAQYFNDIKWDFATFKDSKESEFKAVIEAYDQKLALQAPVDYWKQRNFWNYIVAAILGIIFFVAISVIIYNFEPMAKDVANGIKSNNFYPLMQFGSMAIICIWLLRIIVKIFYSKLHLAEEAKEKEMFIKTYLALLRESDGIKDDTDRHIILQSIFAPSKNGIIQDDGLPLSLVEKALRAKSN